MQTSTASVIWFLVLFKSVCVHVQSCNLTAIWIDEDDDVASMTETENSILDIISDTSKATWWFKANGTANSDTITVTFFAIGAKRNETLTGSVSTDCKVIEWTNGVTWKSREPPLQEVHMVFMTHLDVGFTNLARNVCDTYFDSYFPKAINTSKQLREKQSKAKFVYTSHPWLILEYLDSAAGCAHKKRTPGEIAALEAAIENNDIRWHGMPFNVFPELMDPDFFIYGLSLRNTLNQKYRKQWGAISAQHADVPGMSKAVIPLLAQAGIKAIHLGYNGACRVPNLPPVFVWLDEVSGYDLVVSVEQTYGHVVEIPGSNKVFVFTYTGDNRAPPNVLQVEDVWSATQMMYPNANIMAGSMDDFASIVMEFKESLPVVTDEIGDSWLYGAPADPYRVALLHESRRVIQDATNAGHLSDSNPYLETYLRRLLMVPEHNWGLSVGQYLPALRSEKGNWTNLLFDAVRNRSDYKFLEMGWAEQRTFAFPLPAPQPQHPEKDWKEWNTFSQMLEDQLSGLKPVVPTNQLLDSHFKKVYDPSVTHSCSFYNISFDPRTGAIMMLSDKQGYKWADGKYSMASFYYQTFSMDDFNTFNLQYNVNCKPPDCSDFTKKGMDSAKPESMTWTPELVSMYSLSRDSPRDGCEFLSHLTLPETTYTKYGAPKDVWLNITLPSSHPAVVINLMWFNKTATRLAEAMWLSFCPAVKDGYLWKLNILGSAISPFEIVENGTRHLHAVHTGVSNQNRQSGQEFNITALDTPVVAPGDMQHLLRYDGTTLPDPDGGMHFNLYNNLWGTAFPQWYEDDGLARFQITTKS